MSEEKRKRLSKTKSVELVMKFREKSVRLFSILPMAAVKKTIKKIRNDDSFVAFGLRYLCYNRVLKRCGEKVVIFPGVYIYHPENLEVGTNVSIHEFTYMDAFGGISIGDNVAIAHGCTIVSTDHDYDDATAPIKDAGGKTGKVVLQDGVWLGAGARVMRGVTIGEGAVVGAGAVVNEDIPSMAIAAGVPAKVIRVRKKG